MSFGVLIIGLGQIGMGYDFHLEESGQIYTHAKAFSTHPDFHLVGAVDPDKKKRDAFELSYRSPAYAELEHALIERNPYLVIIAVPTQYHFSTLSMILKNFAPRAVLCEKPLSYNLDEACSMVEMCSKNNVNLYVNYMRRSDPGVIEVKRRIDAGEIGDAIKGVAWYSKGFQHNGSHFFNLLEFWLGPFESAEILDSGRLWEDLDPEPDVRLVFKKGAVVMLAAWEEKFSHYSIELLGDGGRLRYEKGGNTIEWYGLQGDKNFDGYTTLNSDPDIIKSGMERYQWNVAEQLAKALNDSSHHLCSGAEALTTLENMQTCIEKR